MFKKGDIVQFTRAVHGAEVGDFARVVRGGQHATIQFGYNPKTEQLKQIKYRQVMAKQIIEKADYQSKITVLNEIDFSKVKIHEAMSHETDAMSGFITYNGKKIEVYNEGWGGPNCYSPQTLVDEIDARIKREVTAITPDAPDYLLSIDMAIYWALHLKGLLEFEEYIAS